MTKLKDMLATWEETQKNLLAIHQSLRNYLDTDGLDALPVGIGDKVKMRGYHYAGRIILVTDLTLSTNSGVRGLYVKGNVLKKDGSVSMQNTNFTIPATIENLTMLEKEVMELKGVASDH